MRRFFRRLYYRFSWPLLIMTAVCGVVLALVLVLPEIMGWQVETDMQLSVGAVLLLLLLFMTYRR